MTLSAAELVEAGLSLPPSVRKEVKTIPRKRVFADLASRRAARHPERRA